MARVVLKAYLSFTSKANITFCVVLSGVGRSTAKSGNCFVTSYFKLVLKFHYLLRIFAIYVVSWLRG